jgi:hypothetical protein
MMEYVTEDDLDGANIAANFTRVSTIIGPEGAVRLFGFLKKLQLKDHFDDKNWKEIQPVFLERLKDVDRENFDDLADLIQTEFEKLTVEQWTAIFKEESAELELLFNLAVWKKAKPLTTAYLDALRANATGLVDGQQLPSKFESRWQILPDILSETHKPFFYKGLRDHLLNKGANADVIVRVLKLFGPALLERADLSEHSDDRVIRYLIDPLLASANDASLDCLEENEVAFSQVLSGVSASNVDFVVGRILDVYAKADEVMKQRLTKLVAGLGLSDAFQAKLGVEGAIDTDSTATTEESEKTNG